MNKYYFVFIIILSFFSACSDKQDKIIGKWRRLDDDFRGMIVEVRKIGDNYQGEIIETTPTIENYGFFKGEIKWRNIQYKADNYYELESLMSGDDCVQHHMKFIDDKTIYLSKFTKGFGQSTGDEQKWELTK